jgi:hypothetical protein
MQYEFGQLKFPKKCSLCLSPDPENLTKISKEFELATGRYSTQKRIYTVDVPICAGCIKRRSQMVRRLLKPFLWSSLANILFWLGLAAMYRLAPTNSEPEAGTFDAWMFHDGWIGTGILLLIAIWLVAWLVLAVTAPPKAEIVGTSNGFTIAFPNPEYQSMYDQLNAGSQRHRSEEADFQIQVRR